MSVRAVTMADTALADINPKAAPRTAPLPIRVVA